MKEILKGFKQFILRGSVIDLAVGIMIGAAFNSVISSLVKDLMTPFISAIFKQPNFSNFSFAIRGSQFLYGDFINNLISFLITAATVYFLIVVPINKLKGPVQETTKACPECLSKIPIKATRCAFCASAQPTTIKRK
jgi:large conductance mechanosensitive channel